MASPKGHAPYNTKGEGGRPKRFTDEFIENEAEEFLKWMKQPKSVWYETFAYERGYTAQCLSEWAKINDRFREVYQISQTWQKQRLLSGSLFNELNSSITKLVLANTIGWTDKQEQKFSGDAVNPLSFILTMADGKTKDLIDDQEEE